MRANDDDRLAGAPSSVQKAPTAWDRSAETPPVTLRIGRSPGTPAYWLGRSEGEWQNAHQDHVGPRLGANAVGVQLAD
jgi:hypothetical protein